MSGVAWILEKHTGQVVTPTPNLPSQAEIDEADARLFKAILLREQETGIGWEVIGRFTDMGTRMFLVQRRAGDGLTCMAAALAGHQKPAS